MFRKFHTNLASYLGSYLVIISFSSTARILLKLPHGKPLFTLYMLRRTRDTKLLQFFVDEHYNALYIARRTIVSLANFCSASCNRVHQSRLSVHCRKQLAITKSGEGNVCNNKERQFGQGLYISVLIL